MSEVETRIHQGTDGQGRGPRVVTSPAELAAAREARGMSQIDVSQRIKLQVRQVAALEEGNWDLLPGRAFARGALRSYGKLIQADVTQLLEMIGTTDATAQLPRHALSSSVGPVTKSVYERESRGGTWLWVIGGVVAAGALIFHFGSGTGGLFGSGAGGLFNRDGGAATTTTVTVPGTTEIGAAPAAGRGAAASGSVGSGAAGTVGADGTAGGNAGTQPAHPGLAVQGTQSPASTPSAAPSAGSPSGAGIATAGASSTGNLAAAGPSAPGTTAPGTTAAGPSAAGTASAGTAAAGSMGQGAASPAPATSPGEAKGAGPASAVTPAAGGQAQGGSNATAGAAAGASATTAVASVQPGAIRFLPTEDSWVRVTDATGKKLHEALIPAGTPVTVQGKPPYKLRMGNARHLHIVYQGKEVRVPAPNEKNITLLELP